MFSQEVEILVFAVHGEDKDSITEGGKVFFVFSQKVNYCLKRERKNRQKLFGGIFCPGEEGNM